MNSSDYRKQKQEETLRLVQDAYILGVLYGKGLIPQIPYATDLKKQTELIRDALSAAARATAP